MWVRSKIYSGSFLPTSSWQGVATFGQNKVRADHAHFCAQRSKRSYWFARHLQESEPSASDPAGTTTSLIDPPVIALLGTGKERRDISFDAVNTLLPTTRMSTAQIEGFVACRSAKSKTLSG